jgi:hypothetical protein
MKKIPPKNRKIKSHISCKRETLRQKENQKVGFFKTVSRFKKLRTRDAKSTFYRWSKLAIRLSPK